MTDPVCESDAPAPTPPGPGTAKAVVLLAMLGLLAYYNSFHGAFVFDDSRFVGDPNIGRPFKSAMAPRPVIAVTLSVNYWVDRLNPRGYHAFNLAIHVLAALTLTDLVRRTLLMPRFCGKFERWAGWVGLACGAIWLAHPLQTQSVTYVVQRCESLMGLFFLVGLWCVVRGATTTTARDGRWWYSAAIGSAVLGSGCKEMMIVLPPLALIYDRAFLAGTWREALRRRWWLYAALTVPPFVGAAVLALTGFFTDAGGTVGFGVKLFTPLSYALTEPGVILHYLRLSVWPSGLALDYLDWPACTSLAECWPAVSAVAGLVALTAWGVIRNSPAGFLGAWFFFILAPTSSFIPLQDAVFEHRMYLPLAAIVVLIVCGITCLSLTGMSRTSGEKYYVRGLAAAAGIVTLVFALLSVIRNEDYSSVMRLSADNAVKRPNNARVRHTLAFQLFAAGEYEAAERQLDAAAKVPLRLPTLRSVRVVVLRESGRLDEALALATSLVAEQPDADDAISELSLTLLAAGRTTEAAPYFERLAAKRPGNKVARTQNGIGLLETGHPAKADAEFRAAHDLDPGYAAHLVRIARRLACDPAAKPSNLRLAVAYTTAACRMTAEPPVEFVDTLAICLARVGRFPEAAAEASRAAGKARANGDSYLASRIEARAALFRAGKTYIPDDLPKP